MSRLDVLVGEQVGVLDLEAQHRPVAVADRALDRVSLAGRCPAARDQLLEERSVGFDHQIVEAGTLDVVGGVAEHTLHRRALVRHDPRLVENGDQVARVRHERAEARLALAPMQIFGERRSFDRERHLCRESGKSVGNVVRHALRG